LSSANTMITTIASENYEAGIIADAIGASSLFGGTELFIIDTPSDSTEFETEIKNHLKEMGESANIFIVIERALLAGQKKNYSKYAENLEEFKTVTPGHFNAFLLSDALAEKNKKRLWLLLQEAKASGLTEEEIIGTLWWQLKSLRLAAMTNSAAEAGMKDYPYKKAKISLAKFKLGEIEALAHSLLAVYHDGHGGLRDIDTALEKWTLTI